MDLFETITKKELVKIIILSALAVPMIWALVSVCIIIFD